MAHKSRDATVLKAAAALTDTYTDGWVSEWSDLQIPGGHATHARLLLDVVKDGATTIELKAEVEDFDGSAGYEVFKIANGDAAVDEIALTCSELGAAHGVAFALLVADARRIRFRAKRTGGDSGTTLAASLLLGAV